MEEVPICEACGKPLSAKAGWHLAFQHPDGFIWYIHETPCFGLTKDFKALSDKAAARHAGDGKQTMVQSAFSFEE